MSIAVLIIAGTRVELTDEVVWATENGELVDILNTHTELFLDDIVGKPPDINIQIVNHIKELFLDLDIVVKKEPKLLKTVAGRVY